MPKCIQASAVPLDDRVQGHHVTPQVEPAGVDPGHVEQVGDEPGDSLGVGLDRLDDEALLLVAEAIPVLQDGAGEALDRGQRRAQLVGKSRDQRRVVRLGALAGRASRNAITTR